MEHHPYFDLWLHSTDELTEILRTEIIERTTLHEWPLSCVQLLKLSDGIQWIYKSQFRATTVEPEFFASIQELSESAHRYQHLRKYLPAAKNLGVLNNSATMLLEFIDEPHLEDRSLDETAILEHGDHLLAVLQQFPFDLPAYTDIRSLAKWSTLVGETLSMIENLIASGQFILNTMAGVEALKNWSKSNLTLAVFQAQSIFNHHDLGGDNVFVTPDGYKIIDWQRPVRGPAGLDLACYLSAMRIDPRYHLSPGILGVFWFLRLRWLVECKAHWFPEGEVYDRQVADLADQILQL